MVGEYAELANPSGFFELPKLSLFSFVEVSNQETFLSMFPLLCLSPKNTQWLAPASAFLWL